MAKSNNTVNRSNRNNRTNRSNNSNLPMSEVIRRKSRMIGSDDLQTAANLCRWAEQAGFHGPQLQVAEGLAKAFDAVLELSTRSQHYEAAKKAKSIEYVLKRSERVAGMSVDCRDGRKRKLAQVVSWFADRHFRIAQDIADALDAEALEAARVAEEAAKAAVKKEEKIPAAQLKVA